MRRDGRFHNRFEQRNNSVRLIEAKSTLRLQSLLVLSSWVREKLYMFVHDYKAHFLTPEKYNNGRLVAP